MKYVNQLMTPIGALYDIENVSDVPFIKEGAKMLSKIFSKIKKDKLYEALKWAENNPNYNFSDIMKDAPVRKKLKFKNDEIYQHLMNYKKFMENDEFGLLTDR
ncbi:hypothetical protein PG911_18615 [Tenacibaculum ovolyticum]|uniref:hypothetical protein n=1 Tax=Tenacibaculum ovolyticum TaxID=104270 RepID=UPI0022F3B7C4|nr:hypothetical protein [Tenacibaculum ovolyticum]WBX76600.1 hypothetical protein PG911_18615 [Tenacibaculum ovolyticum]